MGVNVQAKLDNSISIQAIEEVIKQHYEYVRTEAFDNSYFIIFKNNENQRSLHVYIGYNYETEKEISKWLSLGYNKEAIEIMKNIISYFGGWLDENDCDRDYYWVDKTHSLSNESKKEVDWKSYINSLLSSYFTYEEIQKIILNYHVLRDVLEQSQKMQNSNSKS